MVTGTGTGECVLLEINTSYKMLHIALTGDFLGKTTRTGSGVHYSCFNLTDPVYKQRKSTFHSFSEREERTKLHFKTQSWLVHFV